MILEVFPSPDDSRFLGAALQELGACSKPAHRVREQKSRSDGGTCPVCVEESPHGILGGSSCDRFSCRASILQDVCSRAATFQFHFVAKCVQQTLWVCDPLLFPWGFLFHTKQRSTGIVLNFKLASPRSLCDSEHLVEKVLSC